MLIATGIIQKQLHLTRYSEYNERNVPKAFNTLHITYSKDVQVPTNGILNQQLCGKRSRLEPVEII